MSQQMVLTTIMKSNDNLEAGGVDGVTSPPFPRSLRRHSTLPPINLSSIKGFDSGPLSADSNNNHPHHHNEEPIRGRRKSIFSTLLSKSIPKSGNQKKGSSTGIKPITPQQKGSTRNLLARIESVLTLGPTGSKKGDNNKMDKSGKKKSSRCWPPPPDEFEEQEHRMYLEEEEDEEEEDEKKKLGGEAFDPTGCIHQRDVHDSVCGSRDSLATQDSGLSSPTPFPASDLPSFSRKGSRMESALELDSPMSEGTQSIVDFSDGEDGEREVEPLARVPFSTGSPCSSIRSLDTECTDPHEEEMKQFMRRFVEQIFLAADRISAQDKADFGQMVQTPGGRLWFCRFINEQRVAGKEVTECTFYGLVQYFAICLFECGEADDFTPAKMLMNMSFTFFHVMMHPPHRKEFVYENLKSQLIWRSPRFWVASFFDAIQSERERMRPSAQRTRKPIELRTPEEIKDEITFHENITFGQLGTFTHNMKEYGLSHDFVVQFLLKQGEIANLPREQIGLIRANIESMCSHP